MRNLCKQFAVVMLFLSVFSSCTWNKTAAPLPTSNGNGNGGGSGNIKDSICYTNEIQPILNTYCAKSGCHDAITMEEGYNLSDYSNVMWLVKPGNPQDSKLIKVVGENGDDKMPPAGNPAPTTDQVALIEQWISEGAKLDIDCNVSSGCDTSNVTYANTVVAILQNNCYGCHSSAGSGGGIVLTSYSQVKQQVDNGKLWGAINHNAGFIPMPLNGAQLSECSIQQIGAWINAGAPNN
jgi:hypothetical protein